MRDPMSLGIGMSMMMACMPIFSLPLVTVCGGTGDLILSALGAGVGTLGLILHTIVGDGATVLIGAGEVGTILSIIIIIGMRMVRIGAGAVVIGEAQVIVRTIVRLQHKEGMTELIVMIPEPVLLVLA